MADSDDEELAGFCVDHLCHEYQRLAKTLEFFEHLLL